MVQLMETDSVMDLELYSSSEKFEKNVTDYLVDLRQEYRTGLLRGDDESVYRSTVSARIVEHAAGVHLSARLLAAVRPNMQQPASRAAEASATKHYLVGVQNRLADALQRRDTDGLEQIAKAATSTINNLANPEEAFGGVEEYEDVLGGRRNEETEKPTGLFCGLQFSSLNGHSKAVLVLYVLMLVGALVSVCFISKMFIMGQIRPHSFLRVIEHNSLPMPVVTLCLSRPGIPHSRFRFSTFKDANNHLLKGMDAKSDSISEQNSEIENAISRFWDNPKNESCETKVGDFYPFDAVKMSNLANGTTKTRCKPCYRFGHKKTTISRSTEFKNSSMISMHTDHYAMECFQRPGGLTYQSRDFLQDVVYRIVQLPEEPLAKLNILNRADGGNMRQVMIDDDEFERLSGQQLCNLFYFALFPKQLGKIASNDTQIRYTFNGSTWHFTGTGREFIPAPRGIEETDTEALENIEMYVSHNGTVKKDSVAGEKDVVHIGANSQTVVSLRDVNVYKESRFDLHASTSSFVANDVRMEYGFWLNCRIFYAYNRFITESIYRKSTYPFVQYLVDFTGYLSLFTGASIFSVFLLPVLCSMRARQRVRLRQQNPDAYVLNKYKNKIGIGAASDKLAIPDDYREDQEAIPVSLPGYNV